MIKTSTSVVTDCCVTQRQRREDDLVVSTCSEDTRASRREGLILPVDEDDEVHPTTVTLTIRVTMWQKIVMVTCPG